MRRRQKRSASKIFIALAVIVISLCVTFILLYLYIPHPTTAPQVIRKLVPAAIQNTPAAVAISQPAELKIDSINVNAVINPVGLTSSGDMDIDENPTELAWYKLGPKPGEIGSAVIAGHYGWKDNVPSVFNDLNKLVKGDSISVYGEDGQVKTFIVNHSELYAPNQDATLVFKSGDGKAHLNLITCQGSWNNSARTYSERLVVFTDLLQ